MAESMADKILDFVSKFSLVKPERPLSEMVKGTKEVSKENLTNYRDFNKQEFNRGSAEGIWDKISQWFGKSSPYTKPRGPGAEGEEQFYPTRPGYKY